MEKKENAALFIGRFQPFHNGHLFAVKHIAKRSSRIFIVIGSSQEKGTAKNPFPASERKSMVECAIAELNLPCKVKIAALKDTPSDSEWLANLDALIPHYDVCYSNNPRVISIMKKAKKKVSKIPLHMRHKYNATNIRKAIASGKDVSWAMPKCVLAIIKKSRFKPKMRRQVFHSCF